MPKPTPQLNPTVLTKNLAPSELIINNIHLLDSAPTGYILDLACGSGRNGLYLAKHINASRPTACNAEHKVIFADINADCLVSIQREIDDQLFDASTWCTDFETPNNVDLVKNTYAVVLVFRYLYRPLLGAIKDAIKPGGLVFYETFTTSQPKFGRPNNPNFLLKPQELLHRFEGWDILHYQEGIIENSALARIICRKPAEPELIP